MQAQNKVKAYELRKLNEDALLENLNKARTELVKLRTSKVSSAPQVKLAHIRVRNHSNFLVIGPSFLVNDTKHSQSCMEYIFP